jgi:hypothetical protein
MWGCGVHVFYPSYGALVWGAYLLGKGVRITVQVELSDRDREAIGRIGRAGTVATTPRK